MAFAGSPVAQTQVASAGVTESAYSDKRSMLVGSSSTPTYKGPVKQLKKLAVIPR